LSRIQKRNRPKTAKETERLLTKHFLPQLFGTDLPSITTQQLDRILDRLEPPSIANHAFVAARTFFRWCVARRYILNSPLEGVSAPATPTTTRSRVLSDKELISPNVITEMFGEAVTALVEEVTDDKALPKEERKQAQVDNAAKKSPRAKMLKLADKTSNLNSIAAIPPAGWSVKRRLDYIQWARDVAAGLRGVSPWLESRFDEAALEAERSTTFQR
jgi:hypothetical protein